jgi:hypothetical protein
MIFVGPYLSDPNCHFNMNVVDSIGSKKDLVIDIKEDEFYLGKIKKYLKDKNIEDEVAIYNPFEKEDFVIAIKRELPQLKIFMYCSDDEWRCFNYDRYLALYVDFFSITAKKHLKLYNKWGFKNVLGTNWACNPNKFYPLDIKKEYDVTFIGAPYGKRIDYVKEAIANNINIKVFGKGWDKFQEIKPYWGGFVSFEDMNKIINQSRINLNFMWSSQGGYQVKGRNFELSGCKIFQLCNYGDELLEYFEPDIDIGIFKDKKDFIEKIKYYLENDYKREQIANNSYKLTMKKHTWDIKFKEIFDFGKDKKVIEKLPKFKILVIANDNVKHNIRDKDDRFDIDFKDLKKDYDGVIELQNDSTINNETLYLMAFSLYADKSEIVLSNFYIHDIWIRFKEENILKKKYLIKYLPSDIKMFKNKILLNKDISVLRKYSIIEYPTYKMVNMPTISTIILKILFSSYHQKEVFNLYKKNRNIYGMFKIISEYACRKIIFK